MLRKWGLLLGVVIGAVLAGVLEPASAIAAGPSVVCDDPSIPGTCVLSTSIPGSDGGNSQNPEVGSGQGGIKPNDGSGSAADYVASKGDAGVGSADAAVAGDSKPIASTECDWTALAPSPGAGDPRWGGADPTANTPSFRTTATAQPGTRSSPMGRPQVVVRRRLRLHRLRTLQSWLSRPSGNCRSRSPEFS